MDWFSRYHFRTKVALSTMRNSTPPSLKTRGGTLWARGFNFCREKMILGVWLILHFSSSQAGWLAIGRLCGHPQPIKIWFSTIFWGNFGYFHQNFTKTQIMEFFVIILSKKFNRHLKKLTLEILLSQYNGEKIFLLNFENYP